ncbi:type 1 glutamine amidotransferase family protein [Proteiniphilum saccharofermentans]|uniref:type 1 glutamine amidotransferase family protein n=1 Tax=Proteiniphilum saccharofermentans TaxID=1642647 RepID=UPI0028B23E7F|nr:type 1 glutamine amidotransferase family protein [Proteiniphilum saccharofermentans]
MKNICIFLFDGYSDWEIGYLAPEIAKNKEFEIRTFSLDGKSVRSAGNLQVLPDCSLNDIKIDEITMLILPGGYTWEDGKLDYIIPLVKLSQERKITIAAICGATIFLARNGFLDEVKHTSNDLDFLKMVAPNYKGEHLYQQEKAYSDKYIITANGTAPIEFAKEIFESISLYDSAGIEKWYQLFKNGIWSE